MPVGKRTVVFSIFALAFCLFSFPDSVTAAHPGKWVVRSVNLEGYKQTKPSIILRELTFRTGDTLDLDRLDSEIRKTRENLTNTSLFTVVNIDTLGGSGDPRPLDVTVRVIERWYIWPIPYLEFPEQNLNVWLRDPKFSHLTVGVNLAFNNARGRNETLILLMYFGYNMKFGFTYEIPYVNRKKTWGVGFGADASLNHTLIVSVEDHGNVYAHLDDQFLQQRYGAFVEVYHRPAWYLYQTLNVSYTHYFFADTLRQVEGFFPQNTSLEQYFFSWTYKLKFDRRDDKSYPLKGYYADLILVQNGIPGGSPNRFAVQSSARGYWKLAHRWYAAAGITGMASLPDLQPFYLQTGVGYGRDFLRGYDSQLIPGQHFLTSKNNIKFALVPQRVVNLPFISSKKFSVVPCALYLGLFADMGYVWNSDEVQSMNNTLTNSYLLGTGLELDFSTYYDIVIGAGVSYNIQGKPGAFIHLMAPI